MSEIFEVELPEQFTIASVMAISEKMLESFKSGAKEVSLRAANVARADAAAIQLLCSFAKTANKEHMLFKLDQPSDEIKKSLSMLGMSGFS